MSNERDGLSIARLKELVRERSKRAALPLDERRKVMDGNAEMFPVPPGATVESADLGGLGAEWAHAGDSGSGPVVLYFHGGGYVVGSPVSHRHLTARLALAAGASVLSVAYRLAPEAPFPAAVEDGLKAYRWLLARGDAPERIALAGDSAGGGLAMAVLLAAKRDGLPMPAAAALLSPWTDLTCATATYASRAAADPMITQAGIREMAALYLDGADPRAPLASPNFGDLTGLPPLLIQVGSDEVLLDDARDLDARARAAGVAAELEVWDDMIHVWHAFYQMLPEGERAIMRLGAWLGDRLAAPAGRGSAGV
ncbi:alpha/beta hydrolase [uncultured Parvibaculum sp.]|uniref:alpha/beta hydrolase n=1 Tax=uncultured Parvibaculum sp. TaxID=291828 RepID=UPI0030DB2240|tara:strand:+ start:101910 stop:102842 length:933 start_codon:yes stop_codon:yes gene_type:complete